MCNVIWILGITINIIAAIKSVSSDLEDEDLVRQRNVTDNVFPNVTVLPDQTVTPQNVTVTVDVHQPNLTNITKASVTDTTSLPDHTNPTGINQNTIKLIDKKCPNLAPKGWAVIRMSKLEKLFKEFANPGCEVNTRNLSQINCDRKNVTFSMIKRDDLLELLHKGNKMENCTVNFCSPRVNPFYVSPLVTGVIILPMAQMNKMLETAKTGCGINSMSVKWARTFDECYNKTMAALSTNVFKEFTTRGNEKCQNKKQCLPPYNRNSRLKSDVTKALVITEVYVYSVFCFLGIIGNILSFLTLSSTEKVNTSIFILKTLAIVDGIHLLIRILTQPFNAAYYYTDWIEKTSDKLNLTLADTYIKVIYYAKPLIEMFQMASTWLVVFLTLDRYIAICFPFKALSLCSMKMARLGISIVIVGSLLYNVPLYFSFSYDLQRNECTRLYFINTVMSPHGKNILYRVLYTLALHLIFRNVLPVGLVLGMNARLVHELRLSGKRRQKITLSDADSDKREKNITVTLISISFVFLICITPMVAFKVWQIIVYSVFKKELGDAVRLVGSKYSDAFAGSIIYSMVVDLLLIINSAVNILVYCLVRKHFVSDMCRMFRCKSRRSLAIKGTQSTGSSKSSMTKSGPKRLYTGSGKRESEPKDTTNL